MLSLFNMAKKAGKTRGKAAKNKTKKADPKAWKQEKEETVTLKQVAKDERTWKITGAVFILISLFLFIFLPGKKTRIRFSGEAPPY